MDTPEHILKGCRQQKSWAQKELYCLYKRRLMGICMRYCGSAEHAHDVLQESFIQILTRIDSFKGSGTFEGWMTRIVINKAISFNKRWNFRKTEMDLQEIDIPFNDIHPEQNLTLKELLALVQKLPSGYRVVFNMHVIDGFSHEEIAQELGISSGTSKSQLSRAKATLARWIRHLEPNEKHYEKLKG